MFWRTATVRISPAASTAQLNLVSWISWGISVYQAPPCQQVPTSSTSIVMIDKGYVGLRPMEGPGGNAQVIFNDPIAVGCKSVNVVEGRIEGY